MVPYAFGVISKTHLKFSLSIRVRVHSYVIKQFLRRLTLYQKYRIQQRESKAIENYQTSSYVNSLMILDDALPYRYEETREKRSLKKLPLFSSSYHPSTSTDQRDYPLETTSTCNLPFISHLPMLCPIRFLIHTSRTRLRNHYVQTPDFLPGSYRSQCYLPSHAASMS